MPRRNIFKILDDYLANPSDKNITNEVKILSDELISEAKRRFSENNNVDLDSVEPDDYVPFLEKIIIEDAENASNSSDRLIKSEEKLVKEELIDAEYVYQVSPEEQQLIDKLIDHIKNAGNLSPFGLDAVHSLFIERKADSGYQYLEDSQANTIKNNHIKVLRLKKECQKYLSHLENSINKLAKEMPSVTVQRYTKENSSEVDVQKLIDRKKKGLNFYWINDPGFPKKGSSKAHPSLYTALDKYQIVKQLLDDLDQNEITNEKKLEQFKTTLTSEKHKLLNSRDNKTVRFIKNVLHVLSGGIYSKLSKGTFAFWKTHGEAFSDKADEIQPNKFKP